jgi:hypothetical protein
MSVLVEMAEVDRAWSGQAQVESNCSLAVDCGWLHPVVFLELDLTSNLSPSFIYSININGW